MLFIATCNTAAHSLGGMAFCSESHVEKGQRDHAERESYAIRRSSIIIDQTDSVKPPRLTPTSAPALSIPAAPRSCSRVNRAFAASRAQRACAFEGVDLVRTPTWELSHLDMMRCQRKGGVFLKRKGGVFQELCIPGNP